MFGYITVNKPELKIKDFEDYRAYYCGLCRILKNRYGRLSQLTLSYDMTFLSLLLTALYEPESKRGLQTCLLHPTQKHPAIINKYSEYAADMSLLLSYFNLEDNWHDDRDMKSRALSLALKKHVRQISESYPRQFKAVFDYIKKLHAAEEEKNADLDSVAGLTGDMLSEIFVPEDDIWAPTLRRFSFYLGKFIYLADALDDIERDKKSGSYNPWLSLPELPDEGVMQAILNSTMGECAMAFEMLPIVEYQSILRNIIYSGVWTRLAAGKEKEAGND